MFATFQVVHAHGNVHLHQRRFVIAHMKNSTSEIAYLKLRRPARLIPGMSGGSGPGGVPLSWGSLKPAADGCISDQAPAEHEKHG